MSQCKCFSCLPMMVLKMTQMELNEKTCEFGVGGPIGLDEIAETELEQERATAIAARLIQGQMIVLVACDSGRLIQVLGCLFLPYLSSCRCCTRPR